MKTAIKYIEFISHTEGEIILSDTREQFAQKMRDNYVKQFNKKKTPEALEYFLRDAGAYHKVRDILENIKTDGFDEVVKIFKQVYPEASNDWKSALKCGLVVKAGAKVGNYSNGEFIFNCDLSKQIRKTGINGDIEKLIFSEPEPPTFKDAYEELRKATGTENKNSLLDLIEKAAISIRKQLDEENPGPQLKLF